MAFKKTIVRKNLLLAGIEVPVEFIHESRSNVRFSLTQKCAILRLPRNLSKQGEQEAVQWFYQILSSKLKDNPELKRRFVSRAYADGQQLQVGANQYRLHLLFEDRRSSSGKRQDNDLFLKINQQLSGIDLEKAVKKLLSDLIGKHQLPVIRQRLSELNQLHFGHPVRDVRLRHLQSRWGSCSSSGNITLSTRLLFAPPEVIDYVIIHELAHLSVFDHSQKFWDLVAAAMPDYREKEEWLKSNHHQCNF